MWEELAEHAAYQGESGARGTPRQSVEHVERQAERAEHVVCGRSERSTWRAGRRARSTWRVGGASGARSAPEDKGAGANGSWRRASPKLEDCDVTPSSINKKQPANTEFYT